MPIFLKENQELDGNQYKIPDNLQTHLNQTLGSLGQYSKSKGYKRLNKLVNPKYNKRSDKKENQKKDGTYLSYGDLKKIDHEFRHMDKNPNNLQRLLNGGEKMANYVHNKLEQERTKVAPVLKQKKVETRNKNKVKPTVAPMKPIQLGNINASITESYNSNENPYNNYLCDYDVSYVFNAFENDEKLWFPLINPDMYQKALQEFTKYGKFIKFPTKYIYQWMGIIMKNTALLRACTEIAGHDMYSPLEEFIDYYFYNDDNDKKWEEYKLKNNEDSDYSAMFDFLDKKGFFEWYVLPDGTDAISDFGIEPIENIINEYNSNLPPEKVIVLINRILDVYHCRGDLASAFITGGSKILTQISEMKKNKKIYIKENKLNLLKDLNK